MLPKSTCNLRRFSCNPFHTLLHQHKKQSVRSVIVLITFYYTQMLPIQSSANLIRNGVIMLNAVNVLDFFLCWTKLMHFVFAFDSLNKWNCVNVYVTCEDKQIGTCQRTVHSSPVRVLAAIKDISAEDEVWFATATDNSRRWDGVKWWQHTFMYRTLFLVLSLMHIKNKRDTLWYWNQRTVTFCSKFASGYVRF